jgi:UDP-glucose 4-epimerase
MKKILITGSSGYIGQHLVNLLSSEYTLEGLDRKALNNVKLHTVDINYMSTVLDHEYDAVVHLAALVNVGQSVQQPIDYYQTNITGTLNVLRNVRCNNFIFASTGAAENPQSPYGLSKRAAEDVVESYCNTHRIDYTIFRFYNVIGSAGPAPTNPDGLFYNLIKAVDTGEFWLHGNDYNTRDGTCIRDYVHVVEICHAIRTAIENPAKSLQNLGHGQGYTVQEIVDIFKQVNHVNFAIKPLTRRPGDLEKSVLDTVSPYMKNLFSIQELLRMN